jgi:hypothetical protein
LFDQLSSFINTVRLFPNPNSSLPLLKAFCFIKLGLDNEFPGFVNIATLAADDGYCDAFGKAA